MIGIPTLYRIKAGEKFSKGVPKDIFRKFSIISLKPKGGPNGKFSTSSFDLI
jgi:hypothetical protein